MRANRYLWVILLYMNKFIIGLGRAFSGALIFTLPLLMTMEMWALGVYMDRWRLILLLLLSIPLLVGMSHYIGFEETFELKEDVVDAFVAFAVSYMTAFALLRLFNIITADTPFAEQVGMVALQAVPGAVGALLAQSELGNNDHDPEKNHPLRYGGEIFLMTIGALFLALNLAPTEEIVLIAYTMTVEHALTIVALSLILMHALVYVVKFHGQHDPPKGRSSISLFFTYTVPGYAVVLLISLYILWTLGRTDGTAFTPTLMAVIVLALPGSIGAAAARLII